MKDIEIKDLFWRSLIPGEQARQAWTDVALWERFYDHGFVDLRRLPKSRWMSILNKLPAKEGRYALTPDHVKKLDPYLYSGPIKRPFDPQRLKAGIRPMPWVQEMYQKVLKFETDLKLAEWNQLLQKEINPRFLKGKDYHFSQEFKDYISDLLEERASPLRKLELWVYEGPPEGISTQKESPKAPSQKNVQAPEIKDRFENQPEDVEKMRSIEKLYYHSEKGASASDQETLSFLDELEELEDEGEDLE